MNRNWLVIKLLIALVLASCAGPVQVAPQSAPEVDMQLPANPAEEEAQTVATEFPTEALVPEPAVAAIPTVAQVVPTQPVSTAPLAESVLLASENRKERPYELHAVNPATGLDIAGYGPINLGRSFSYTVSPDRKTLAVLAYPAESNYKDGVLHLIDLQNWRETATPLVAHIYANLMAFSPDGARLAIAFTNFYKTHRLALVDVASQTATAQIELSFPPSLLEFAQAGPSNDSLALVAYGSGGSHDLNPEPRATLFDPANLNVVWELALPQILDGAYGKEGSEHIDRGFWRPAVVLSSDRSKLYIVHPDEDIFTTVDLASGTAAAVDIKPPQSWLEQLLALTAGVAHAKMLNGTLKDAVLSPDGSRLYVTGQTTVTTKNSSGQYESSVTPLGLQMIDPLSGTEIEHVVTEANELSISADGARLYLRQGWEEQWTDVMNASTLEVVARVQGRGLYPGFRLGGGPVLFGPARDYSSQGQTDMAVLDPETLEPLHIWMIQGYARWIGTPYRALHK